MFSVPDFLDRAKSGAGGCTDYRLAKLLGVTQSSISGYRTGVRAPDARTILKLCQLSGDDPEHVAACIQSMRAANDDESRLWQRVADRLQRGAAHVALVALIAIVLGALQTAPAQYAADELLAPVGSLYIMLSASLRMAYRLMSRRNACRRFPTQAR